MEPNQRQRSAFRHHLLLTGVAATLGFGIVIALSLFLPLAVQLEHSDPAATDTAGIAGYLLFLHGSFWPVLLCALVGSIVTAMLLYQRMTGPLARFVRAYDAVARGECPDDIGIRRTDYLSLEAAALNRMLAGLRARARDRAAGVETLAEIADELAQAGADSHAIARLREALKLIR